MKSTSLTLPPGELHLSLRTRFLGWEFSYDWWSSSLLTNAAANLDKNGVTFRGAMTVFDDPLAATPPDELHSEEEGRWITIWLSSRHRVLFISHLEQESFIRIIGARTANATEIETYEEASR